MTPTHALSADRLDELAATELGFAIDRYGNQIRIDKNDFAALIAAARQAEALAAGLENAAYDAREIIDCMNKGQWLDDVRPVLERLRNSATELVTAYRGGSDE